MAPDALSASANGLPLPKLSPSVIEALLRYDWPGNLRELRNAVEHGAIDCDEGEIKLVNLPAPIRNAASRPSPSSQSRSSTDDGPISSLVTALIKNGYNRTQTARELGVSRMTVYNMLQRLGVG